MAIFKKIILGILGIEARLIIAKYKPFIIAVTGSVGKTSTKDAIYDVMTAQKVCDERHICYVRKSEKSFNSEIGLPLTVIGVPNAWRSVSGWMENILDGFRLIYRRGEYPDCLVLEIGADHPGDIRNVTKWLKPDISVITKVSSTPVHVEFFASPEHVFEEKAALAEAVKPGGTLVLFGDDVKTASLAERVKDKGVSVISFGMNETAAVRASSFDTLYEGSPIGMKFELHSGGATAPVSVRGILGKPYVYPLLAAAAVGQATKVPLDVVAASLSAYEAPHGRLNIIPGINGSTLIDDTYNSSPDAAIAALETLGGLTAFGDRIAVLGDMMELGKYSTEEHRNVGRVAARTVTRLIVVGPRSQATAEEAVRNGLPQTSVLMFDSSADAASHLSSIVKAGDIVLVKGSQSIRMERVAKALLRAPERAGELLVRQEPEWLEKA